jgi:hypothetical protein
MRVYLPATWSQLGQLQKQGVLLGPLRCCAVDPRWRADAPEVDEEEWEYEAQLLAAEALTEPGGMVLAVDLPDELTDVEEGWVDLPGPVERRQVGALLDSELAWYGLQELGELLAQR